jgi:hypothetical protein
MQLAAIGVAVVVSLSCAVKCAYDGLQADHAKIEARG